MANTSQILNALNVKTQSAKSKAAQTHAQRQAKEQTKQQAEALRQQYQPKRGTTMTAQEFQMNQIMGAHLDKTIELAETECQQLSVQLQQQQEVVKRYFLTESAAEKMILQRQREDLHRKEVLEDQTISDMTTARQTLPSPAA